MIQGTSHFRKVITVLAVTYLLHVNAATNNKDVINEVNKLENYVKTLKTPPELIDSVLKQFENHCKTNRTIDQRYLNNTSTCIEQHLNMTQIANDMRTAIPEGKMDNVFRDICIKWPKVKSCMHDAFIVIDECWAKGDKVSKFVDEVVKFYCGDDNSGGRVAIFFAEGGLECLESHGDEVKRCVEAKQDIELNENTLGDLNELANKPLQVPKTDQICEWVEHLKECASVGLRKCKDPTTENLMTSMLIQVGKGLECKITPSTVRQVANANVSSASRNFIALQSFVLSMSAVFGYLAF